MSDDGRTKPPIRQVPAIREREKRRVRGLPRLRAPMFAILLSLLVFLSPDLTLAPLSAGEPHRAGPVPIDQVGVAVRRPRVQPIDNIAPTPAPIPDVVRSRADDGQFAAAISAARAAAGAYGVTFAAVREGELLWSGADGRQRDARTSLAADDPLVIGSVTKTFVAATVLQLVDEGRLELDDALRDHLPGMSSISTEITIRQLLDHTSGLADVFNDRTRRGLEEQPEHAWTTAEVFETLHAPWYGPGQGWAYANTNYFLLGLVVERVTGSSLATELDERFLGPLELEHTRILTGAADDGGPLAPAWATIFWASGSMTASAADLARWGDALYGGDILSTRARTAMTELNSNDYGMGLQRLHLPGAVGYGHTGLLNTYTSLLIHLPEHDLTLALLVNRSDVNIGSMLAARPPDGPSLLELVGVEWPPVP
ncbi:MAG: beta-lactamase family protein [Chloroflexota bacterium]|nr:beta-lactamase family protein [Chloroflexota bacterium]